MRINYRVFIFIMMIGLFLVTPLENSNGINIVGSTSVQPICEELADEYKKTHGGVDINVQGGGSGLGIKCANNCLADIGMSSKEVSEEDLNEYQIGIEGIAVVVHPDNPISDLSTNQIKNIFSGNISDWNEISGYSGKINVIVREEGSGTLDAFKDSIMNSSDIKEDAIVQNSAGAVKQSIVQDKNAIGFVSLTHLDDDLKDVSIDNVKIANTSILDGSYKLQRPFLLLTNKTPDNSTLDFISWTLSNESSEIFEKEKIIKIDENV